ncbi:lipopolysaccharide biosynthesis protein [Phytohabitans rumicis]|uniref:Polysaccharide chain length determinant N-terminal domain-containing protein n=1 Tax=Phytohabitans rumicis TaxID=1076125 RepID=A0A6V8KZH2_9ACTN|nr:lipopolysaccharide biosynthesis protein [Phytohabitans rumicis]GFJ87237.1 hypothetical protein Prum_008790 [Phytohabitans rumicis]
MLVLLALLGAAAGGVYCAVKEPSYRAESHVVFTGERGESLAAVSFAQAYGRIAAGAQVTDKAAKTLGSRDGLSDVKATTSPDAPVVEITATGADAERTAAVANAVADALVDHASARKKKTRISASVLAQAATPPAPSSPRPALGATLGAVAGLLIGGLAALAGVGRGRSQPQAPLGAGTTPLDPIHRGGVLTAIPADQQRTVGRAVVTYREMS